MNLKIHRGTHEIGGTCVELGTENTRIIIDLGMPLVDPSGKQFDFREYEELDVSELRSQGILPDIDGLYGQADTAVDGVLISHAHQDHYGLIDFISLDVPFYAGKATKDLIRLTREFTSGNKVSNNFIHFQDSEPFRIGDFTVTAFLQDHSGFDAYGFLIKAEGKTVLYTGDFRKHGRKGSLFKRQKRIIPKNVDYLLLEGTQIRRIEQETITEQEIEDKLISLLQKTSGLVLMYTSGQNIDRLVSLYRACLQANRKLVLDFYTASVLKTLSKYNDIPFPSRDYRDLRVYYPPRLTGRMIEQGLEQYPYQFTSYKISPKDVDRDPAKYVLTVRPSVKNWLDKLHHKRGGIFIYSLWKGYLTQHYTNKFVTYLEEQGYPMHYLHTSGHADTPTLQEFVSALQPQCIIPIHTFHPGEYEHFFDVPVHSLQDGEMLPI